MVQYQNMKSNNIDTTLLSYKPHLLKAEEVAKYLNVSRSFVYRLIQKGIIPSVYLGKSRRVRPEDLDNFIEQNIRSRMGDF